MTRSLDWDATAYQAAAAPQRTWGLALLDLRRWRGDEAVLDAGCGPGTLAEAILARVPRGRVLALDHDAGMVEAARKRLAPYGARASVVRADLVDPPHLGPVDVAYSNAVFHWVPDHDALFRRLLGVLVPGGELLAQCGGAGNIARAIRVADEVRTRPPYRTSFQDWTPPWHFESAEATRRRLVEAGFTDVVVRLTDAPVRFDDARAFAAFVRTAPLLPYLTRLADPALQEGFLGNFVDAYAQAGHAWELDYVRLTLQARRPS